jgi:hypothetical protein
LQLLHALKLALIPKWRRRCRRSKLAADLHRLRPHAGKLMLVCKELLGLLIILVRNGVLKVASGGLQQLRGGGELRQGKGAAVLSLKLGSLLRSHLLEEWNHDFSIPQLQ